jgi:poly(3-hydroxybutyrate) depolymerase
MEAGADVELCTIRGGFHEWPTGSDLDANQVIWDFFASHPMP